MGTQSRADEKNYVVSIHLAHFGHAFQTHAAGRRGKNRREVSHGRFAAVRQRAAILLRKVETSAGIGKNRGVRAGEPIQLPKQTKMGNAACAVCDKTALQRGV